ncbi:hypothetical protein KAR91_52945 [Candidatus Pacearchaeota archaeon]|nr:hypothetical protein [Candidatus Pacearchaeota archaeon]
MKSSKEIRKWVNRMRSMYGKRNGVIKNTISIALSMKERTLPVRRITIELKKKADQINDRPLQF